MTRGVNLHGQPSVVLLITVPVLVPVCGVKLSTGIHKHPITLWIRLWITYSPVTPGRKTTLVGFSKALEHWYFKG